MPLFSTEESSALALDSADPLARFRERFELPLRPDGIPWIYLVGNSLGAMPREARRLVGEELEAWGRLGVEGHFHAVRPWYSYHEIFRQPAAQLVGAQPDEVVLMNSLTVNLHLMLASFYRPTANRFRVLMAPGEFPSDRYAVATHVARRGFDPGEAVLVAEPRPGEELLRTEDLEALLDREGGRIALVLMSALHYYTGQLLDLPRITLAAHRTGALVGFDLAHAVGNVPLTLHDWGADFAVWCSYKYLNGGPGAVAGCFVHQRHGQNLATPRLAGWWGNDPASRFRMQDTTPFVPVPGAEGWQVSNPPIMAMAPVKASLDLFQEAGMSALREKSVKLTGYLEYLVDRIGGKRLTIITPRQPEARGCQLSIRVREGAWELFGSLQARGVLGDFREPDVIRLAPVPFYNTFHEVWRAAEALREALA